MEITYKDFFDDLESAIAFLPNNCAKTYDSFNAIFQRCLNEKIGATRLILTGTFAKTDYLLKKTQAPKKLAREINETRIRLRRREELSEKQLQNYCMYDLKHLCLFIAFVYNAKIPFTLARLLPKEEKTDDVPALIGDSMRIIISQWDENYIYGQAEDPNYDNPIKVSYTHGCPYGYDWTYLRNYFYKEAQLNIVRPRKNGDTIFPELIIFEPDYLVDISAIARCFTNYADSPIIHIINKLQPAKSSEAIVLGNLASQLLDETIHQQMSSRTYAESVNEFFKHNAIQLLTTDISPQLHIDAKKQKQNIAQAINVDLPKSVSFFNPKEGIVEPSFFCEMLGLQGRMDYLQLDFKLLMEQKSGKGEYPYNNFHTPRKKEEHYVQALLYVALIRYNYKEIYEQNHGIMAFLLYSKYTNSLLGIPYTAPNLIYKAFKIRNGIAWNEMMLTRPNGFDFLEKLSADSLNEKHVNNNLWRQYQRPQLDNFLNAIKQASPIEKAYYFRFLTFIANEHIRSKLGNKTKEDSGFAAKWHDSTGEKLMAGNIYHRLTLLYPTPMTKGEIVTVKLKFSETEDNDMSNFRIGDIVLLYPYEEGKEPDVRKTIVHRCTIKEIESDTICLKLRATQSDSRVFLKNQGRPWAIEHDFMESSYTTLYQGMQAFLSAPKSRRDLLLLQREPQIDSNLVSKGNYETFNDLSLRVKQAQDFFLIIGPPGTGKTSYGMLNTLEEELLVPDSSVLLTAYTNRAVDEICSKLCQKGIDFIRIGSDICCAEAYRKYLLSAKVATCKNIQKLKETVCQTRVIVGTTSTFGANIPLLQFKTFTLAIIDEASQILEPHIIGMLCAHANGKPSIKKFVMIGDHKQLPAVVQQPEEVSKVKEETLRGILLTDCRLSLFERLLKKYQDNPHVVFMLTRQGRMHHDIASFPNKAFYHGKLQEVPLSHQIATLPPYTGNADAIERTLRTQRVAFFAVNPLAHPSSDKVNQPEADLIATIATKIYEIEKNSFETDKTIGIIVPYRNQIATIRNTIDKMGTKALRGITIDTVERFQGTQRKYIIYGFTVQKYYQLQFLTNNVFRDSDECLVDRKLNVAMTRAKEHLIMVGNPSLIARDPIFKKLIEFANKRHCFIE